VGVAYFLLSRAAYFKCIYRNLGTDRQWRSSTESFLLYVEDPVRLLVEMALCVRTFKLKMIAAFLEGPGRQN
jgi:hypothetical protein